MIKRNDALIEVSPFEAKWDEKKIDINTLAWRDEKYSNAYVAISINKELNLFLSSGYELASSMAR